MPPRIFTVAGRGGRRHPLAINTLDTTGYITPQLSSGKDEALQDAGFSSVSGARHSDAGMSESWPCIQKEPRPTDTTTASRSEQGNLCQTLKECQAQRDAQHCPAAGPSPSRAKPNATQAHD